MLGVWSDFTTANQPQPFADFMAPSPVDVIEFHLWHDSFINMAWSPAIGTGATNKGDEILAFRDAAPNRWIHWNVPLTTSAEPSLADAASGLRDSRYSQAANNILATNGGTDQPIICRVAWEHNAEWFPWKAITATEKASFVTAWRRLVDCFRAVSPRFRFEWCPNVPGGQVHSPEGTWPGDDYVDLVSCDMYYMAEWNNGDGVAHFNYIRDAAWGLNHLADMAASKGKPMTIAEWGVMAEYPTAPGVEVDQSAYIDAMADWIASRKLLYHVYWDSNSAFKGRLSNGQYPLTAARFKQRFAHP